MKSLFFSFNGLIMLVQFESIGFPNHLWKEAFKKLSAEILDAGSYFQLQYDEGYQLITIQDIKSEEHVFLIDHAWTTDFVNARKQLLENPRLVDRLYHMFDLDVEETEEEEGQEKQEDGGTSEKKDEEKEFKDKVDQVWDKMWKFNQTYKVYTGTGVEEPVWCKPSFCFK